MRVKYPRTLHHPASPGVQSDDKRADDLSAFDGATVVVTEKMDGENISLYSDGFHARSLDTGYHPSRAWLARLLAGCGYKIPKDWRVCGEYLYAQHSVTYDALPSFFLAFSVWDDANVCQSWDDTSAFAAQLDLNTVPVLYEGPYRDDLADQIADDLDTETSEGFVIRLAKAFPYDAFQSSVVKWVRAGHVQSRTHWRNAPIVPNGLQPKGAI